MKEQQAAKVVQGYRKRTWRCCRECFYMVDGRGGGPECFIGGFPVAELGYCERGWEPKQEGRRK